MLTEAVRAVLLRELESLVREIEAYPGDAEVWRLSPGISNSAGTLVLHLVGNLEHFIGAVLGQTGFVRDRDAEFATRDLTRTQLRLRIEAAKDTVDATLGKVTPDQCLLEYPIPVIGRRVRIADFLVHLATHLAYHVGQIDYHRRMLDPGAGPVDAVSVAALPALIE